MGQPAMLDFYADWCVACKEFETFTFRDPAVQKRPGIVFFDRAAAERVVHKVVGYQSAGDFMASLSRAAIP